jgi:molybdenum cofactor guanylyltransferase
MGRDKATLEVDGQTLVERVVAVVAQRCDPVFVIAAPGQALPAVPAEILRDEVRGVGPLLATARGLRAAADAGAQRAFVCAVDMPYLTAELIDALTRESEADVVLPWDGRDHYLAGLYRTRLAEPAAQLVAAGERSMRALVDGAAGVDTHRVVLDEQRALTNVNTAADLA